MAAPRCKYASCARSLGGLIAQVPRGSTRRPSRRPCWYLHYFFAGRVRGFVHERSEIRTGVVVLGHAPRVGGVGAAICAVVVAPTHGTAVDAAVELVRLAEAQYRVAGERHGTGDVLHAAEPAELAQLRVPGDDDGVVDDG